MQRNPDQKQAASIGIFANQHPNSIHSGEEKTWERQYPLTKTMYKEKQEKWVLEQFQVPELAYE